MSRVKVSRVMSRVASTWSYSFYQMAMIMVFTRLKDSGVFLWSFMETEICTDPIGHIKQLEIQINHFLREAYLTLNISISFLVTAEEFMACEEQRWGLGWRPWTQAEAAWRAMHKGAERKRQETGGLTILGQDIFGMLWNNVKRETQIFQEY